MFSLPFFDMAEFSNPLSIVLDSFFKDLSFLVLTTLYVKEPSLKLSLLI